MNPTPHPGAPQGNTNALKHGFYSRSFRAAEQTGLAEFDPASLANEIQLMRVFILRTAELGEQAATLAESITLLNVLSRAAISLGVLIRTQQALTLRKESADLADLSTQLNAASRRAAALIKLLPPQSPEPCPPASDPSAPAPANASIPAEVPLSAPPASQPAAPPAPPAPVQEPSPHPLPQAGPGKSTPPIPQPTYSLGDPNCLPSPKCFACPDNTLCPDCQSYLRTHTPPAPFSQSTPPPQAINLGEFSAPLSLFYTIETPPTPAVTPTAPAPHWGFTSHTVPGLNHPKGLPLLK